ncbi:phospholipase D-like domain-containing protein [Streptomyces sp. NPDC059255]|uniref:phospholipase D-like domain-containing protein n=1 Tax=Streptomyces sp. NPDC059255 TaxID=3346793 RepID=UPI0036B08EEB
MTAHQDRAVRVQVVLDESSVSTTGIDPAPYDTLKAALGTDIASTSYVKLCAAGRSCLATGSGGINHNKFLLFSSVGGGAARQAVADKLRAKAAEGCTVDLVYSETDTGTWNALHGQTRLTTRCYQHDHDADPATPNRIVHSKNMMIDGKYAGSVTRLVFTGSHNWSGPALRDNDESMVRINTGSVYDAFLANFTRVRAAAAPDTADNVAACR